MWDLGDTKGAEVMENKHYQYKRIFMFWASICFVAAQTAMFAWQWYNIYADIMLSLED